MSVVAVNPAELPPLTGLISHGVVVPGAGLVFTSGQVAWDSAGVVVCAGDLAGQFAKAYENVDLVLRAAGTSRDRVVKETIYLVGYTTDRAEELVGLLAEARQGHAVPPASTAVGVQSLYADGFLVEIETVAVL